jgi:hypothetical protein
MLIQSHLFIHKELHSNLNAAHSFVVWRFLLYLLIATGLSRIIQCSF